MSLPKPYYSHAGITIYHGDCREILPHVSADACITDPPYSAVTHASAKTENGGDPGKLIDFAPISEDELVSVLGLAQASTSRWMVLTCDYRYALRLEQCPPVGSKFVRLGVWVKPDSAPQFTGDRPAQGWEAVVFLHRAGDRTRWNGGGRRSVFTHNVARGHHPTEKPLPLASEFVALFSDPGEIVLDPFMGSGTTLRAAKDLGRKAVGIEIEERYCEIAAKRLAQEVLFPAEGSR